MKGLIRVAETKSRLLFVAKDTNQQNKIVHHVQRIISYSVRAKRLQEIKEIQQQACCYGTMSHIAEKSGEEEKAKEIIKFRLKD